MVEVLSPIVTVSVFSFRFQTCLFLPANVQRMIFTFGHWSAPFAFITASASSSADFGCARMDGASMRIETSERTMSRMGFSFVGNRTRSGRYYRDCDDEGN